MSTEQNKHTPGPWEVRRDLDYPNKEWRTIHAGGKSVVSAGSFDRHRDGETETHFGVVISEANARLIAAAPDLLAALEDIMRDDDKDIYSIHAIAAQKALAEARGESAEVS